jgi:hypothetical protein
MLPDLADAKLLLAPAAMNHFHCGMQGMMYL